MPRGRRPSFVADRLRVSTGDAERRGVLRTPSGPHGDLWLPSPHAADPATVSRMSRYSAIAASAVGLLRTPQGKRIGAQVVDGAARAADRVTGAKHSDRIERARDLAHRGLGRL